MSPRHELSPLFTWRGQIASRDSGLSATQRHVALTLSLHMSERGDSCFPSVSSLCDESGLSNRTVIDALRALRDRGWLHVREGGGRGHPNRYTAVVPERVKEVHSSPNGEPDDGGRAETVNLARVNSEGGSQEDVRRGRTPEDVKDLARPLPRDPIWDVLEAIFGPAPIAKGLRGAWNTAAKELRDQQATAEEVAVRFARYRADMPEVACTPMALAKHWGRYAEETPATRPVSKFAAARAARRLA